jgi:hypothetical protein
MGSGRTWELGMRILREGDVLVRIHVLIRYIRRIKRKMLNIDTIRDL